MANTNNQREKIIKIDFAGKIPPHSAILEETVLGQLMISEDAYSDVMNLLKKEVFFVPKHQDIFQAMEDIAKANAPITLVTVIEKLQENEKLEGVGGTSFISELTMKVSSAANIEYNAKLLVQKQIQRDLIKASAIITDKAYDPACQLNELTDLAEKEIIKVTDKNLQKRQIVDIKDAANDVFQHVLIARDAKRDLTGVPTGFSGLDRITSGWQPGNMIVLAARPGMGKTAFVLSMILNMSKLADTTHPQGYPVGMFSLEMSCEQLATRLLVGESRIEQIKLQKGAINDTELERLSNVRDALSQAPIYLDDTPGLNIYEFRSKCRRMKERYKVECIIVDYLQLMSAGSSLPREQEVSTISRQIKSVAMELKVPIIALSQLNRGVEGRTGTDKRPRLSDLRESGAIEQDADMVMFIHRESKATGQTTDKDGNDITRDAQIIIAKNRHGSSGDVNLEFIGEYMKFQDPATSPTNPNAFKFQTDEGDSAIDVPSSLGNSNMSLFERTPQDTGSPFSNAGLSNTEAF